MLAELSSARAIVDERGRHHGSDGRMIGVLVGAQGEMLRAFSGWLADGVELVGWAPNLTPAPHESWRSKEDPVAKLTQQIEVLQSEVDALRASVDRRIARTEHALREIQRRRHERKERRHRERDDGVSAARAAELSRESQRDGRVWRRARETVQAWLLRVRAPLAPLEAALDEARAQRRMISRGRNDALQAGAVVPSFRGERCALASLFAGSPPTGAGECCAPKLLAWAQTRGVVPVAMAEAWWDGASSRGPLRGACVARCVPMLGFMLCGVEGADVPVGAPGPMPRGEIEILYAHQGVWVVNKPAGLPSVPGRDALRASLVQVLSELHGPLYPAHRLDMDTSGVMVLARTPELASELSQQFAARQVVKVYQARVQGRVHARTGEITLQHRLDPSRRPCQVLDPVHGKVAITRWRRVAWEGDRTRVDMMPITGRTHQLRFAAAHPAGLGHGICGDRLYGEARPAARLELHARRIELTHPVTGERIEVECAVPF